MNDKFDFGGWATRSNIKCGDGRVIMHDAFKENDGQTVPLVWMHQHDTTSNVLGHAELENRGDGVYAYCKFNDTESGKEAKLLVKHGDVTSLSIYANHLKQRGSNVIHGNIREVSLVIAGQNPGAYIDSVICHGEESDDEATIYSGENLTLYHSDDVPENKETNSDDDETVADVFNTLSEKQKNVVYALIAHAVAENIDDDENDEEDDNMKHNIFEQDGQSNGQDILSHSDMEEIIGLAKNKGIGSLQNAISIYAENNSTLAHGIDDIESLFPDYKDVRPGAPEFIERDQGWVTAVMNKTHKSPISRIRTRQADIRGDDLRAHGYKKGEKKKLSGNIKLLKRTTDPQTVYRKDALNRDDIVDITDFDVVEYQYSVMRQNLNEDIATAIMIGDGREDGDESKIYEEHIRSIWHDDDLYTIHASVDLAAAKNEL